MTGGSATGTIAWITAVIYAAYEELDIMVLSRIVRERDRLEAESQRQEAEAQRQEAEAQKQEAEIRQRALDIKEMELAERQRALAEREIIIQNLAEHLPERYREEFERLASNGKEPEAEQ